jgi:hypothetical protein
MACAGQQRESMSTGASEFRIASARPVIDNTVAAPLTAKRVR